VSLLKKLVVFIVGLSPLLFLGYLIAADQLGPDAGKEVVLYSGTWAMRLLLITLAVSTVRRLSGNSTLIRYRRMLGLYCWFYATLHLLAIMTYLLGWSWSVFLEEFSERPYMALGIMAWLLLVPLAITSNNWSQRRMGKKWKTLHRSIYIIGVLACAHVIWIVRSDYGEALLYSTLLLLLFAERFFRWAKRKAPPIRG